MRHIIVTHRYTGRIMVDSYAPDSLVRELAERFRKSGYRVTVTY